MSVDKWAYNPIKCDGDYCPGDCDRCQKANVPEDATMTIEELINTFKEWKRRSVEFLDRRLMDTTETIIVYDATIKALESQLAMRNATKEERESTTNYIDSISKPTGLQFDDVYEEFDFVQLHKKLSVNLQLCDVVSRESILNLIEKGAELHPYKVIGNSETYSNYNQGWADAFDWLDANIDNDNLPSAKLQPCADCLSREEVIDVIKELPNANPSYWNKCDVIDRADLIYLFERLESVKSQPIRGHWEDCSNGWMCSNCDRDVSYESDFCPHCGADMRGENK